MHGGRSNSILDTWDDIYDHQGSWYYEHKESGKWGTSRAWRELIIGERLKEWEHWNFTKGPGRHSLHNGWMHR
jgi:hypothetical protein